MAGLLNPTGQTPPPPTRDRMPTDTLELGDPGGRPTDDLEDEDDETPNVAPEEQAEYERFVRAGFELLYAGGEVRPGILEMLDEDPADLVEVLGNVEELKQFNPTVALAATAVLVVLEVVRRMGENRPDGAIVLHGGKEILEDIAEIARAAKIHDFDQDELNRAMLMAMDLYREAASAEGLVDLEALKAEFEEIKQADQEGRAEELLPGISRYGSPTERTAGGLRE